ncbi:MAG TPA: hypothetical protein ENG24_02590 [Thermoplasmatales archaeon]|nr:hypothetical protein [Thermoplasmatales archaeon]
MGDEADKKKWFEELRNAEKKYQLLIQRRNELNEIARNVKEERDMINKRRRELLEEMKKKKEERNKLAEKMKQHKEMRDKLQKQAKELIQAKRSKKGSIIKSLPLRAEELKADIQMLEYRQETEPMSTEEENELIEKIRRKKKEYEKLKKELEKQKIIEVDLSDTEKAIKGLFKKADEEHQQVQKYYKEMEKTHKKFVKLMEEVAALINEAKKKHEKFMAIKEEADKLHVKAVEMRSKIITIKKERRKHKEEARRMLGELNKKAQQALLDEKKIEELTEQTIEALKKGQKISLT